MPASPLAVERRGRSFGWRLWLALQEGEQVSVDLVVKGGGETVWRARVVDFLPILYEPGRFAGRVVDGDDLVVLAVHDKRRHVERREVIGEVGLRKGLDAFVGV